VPLDADVDILRQPQEEFDREKPVGKDWNDRNIYNEDLAIEVTPLRISEVE